MSERFYLNWPLTPGPVTMTGPEARHLAAVCRLRRGDQLCLFNGDGHEYPARVLESSKQAVHLEVLGVAAPSRELPFALEVAAPLPKGDRAHFLVEKLTELGVKTFVPLLCQRSVVHPREGKIDKLMRYVIEASKQCGRNVLMQVEDPVDWATYCGKGGPGELRLIAHPTSSQAPNCGEPAKHATIRNAIGPEGGFTDDEFHLAVTHGWLPVNLGPRILRMETAALYLAAASVCLTQPPL